MSNLFSTGGAGNVGFSGEVQQSLKFNDDESQYLSWTPASAPTDAKTATWSVWVKRGNISTEQYIFGSRDGGNNHNTMVRFNSDNKLMIYDHDGSSTQWNLQTNRLFRDAGAWYHICVALDTAQATSSDRLKLYVNGTQETSFSTSTYPTQNDTMTRWAANGVPNFIGTEGTSGGSYADGYLSDINFIDGQALTPTSFGQFTNGYWEKKDYAGSYGTNGFHLTFEDDVVSEGFNTVTYAGNGSTQSVSGLGFSPDLVWIKTRQAESHGLWDSVRGAPLNLSSNNTNAEGSYTGVTSFDSDGFSLGGAYAGYTESGKTYVAWCWDAGSGSAASNTDGTITSTVKANPDYGFSIVSYTGNGTGGSTIGHGLSGVDMLIIKDRDSAQDWNVYHKDVGTTNILALNSTSAAYADGAAMINSTAPSASLITLGFGGASNGSGRDYIAYCFAEVAGYSSIGSYTGNGSTSGPTVTTGFRPAFVMFKNADGADDWVILDNTRNPSNPVNSPLFPSGNYAEETNANRQIEISDTGFQVTSSGQWINGNGQNIIYMAFADTREAAFWKDVSGQGNHWTPNNLDYRDSLPDSPANNFATLNSTFATSNSASQGGTLSEGNLRITTTGGFFKGGTFAPSSGKWYFEGYAETVGAQMSISFADYSAIQTGYPYVGYLSGGGLHQINGNALDAAGTHPTWTSGDIISCAIDIDAGKIWWAKNGVWIDSGDPAAGTNPPTTFTANTEVVPYFMCDNAAGTKTWISNFGQDSTFAGAKPMGAYTDDNSIGNFQYAPPAGYLALCTANLPTPTIIDGSEYFNTVLYTGDGVDDRSITGVGFQPDFIWGKSRSSAYNHELYDVIRGTGNRLSSDNNYAEQVRNDNLQAFESDGFQVGTGVGLNGSGSTYAAWNWKAGGTAVSNTAGTITSQVSANVDAGFSIVSYTGTGSGGATVGHSLGVKPDMVIAKNRTDAANWLVWHKDLSGEDYYLHLERTDAQAQNSAFWSAFSSTTFTLGNSNHINGSGDAIIAYCFANTDGYLKAGSYTGNGSTSNPPFVFTGFRPAWVLIKCSSASSTNWLLLDNKREGYNSAQDVLFPESNAAEETNAAKTVDFLSNGFKVAATANGSTNASGGTYIYLAFAETPQKFANAR